MKNPSPSTVNIMIILLAWEKVSHRKLVKEFGVPGTTAHDVLKRFCNEVISIDGEKISLVKEKNISRARNKERAFYYINPLARNFFCKMAMTGIYNFELDQKEYDPRHLDLIDDELGTFDKILNEIALEILDRNKLPLWKKLLDAKHNNKDPSKKKKYIPMNDEFFCFPKWNNEILVGKIDDNFRLTDNILENKYGVVELSDFGIYFYYNNLIVVASKKGENAPLTKPVQGFGVRQFT